MKYNPIYRYSIIVYMAVGIIAFSVFFYFVSKDISLFGIVYGMFAGLIDLQVSSYILNKVKDDKNPTKQYSVLVFGFFFRMVFMLGGGFALEQYEKYCGISFALTYLAAHFAHIAGFAIATLKSMKEEQIKATNAESETNPDTTENKQEPE